MIKSLFEILPIYEYEDRIEVSDWVKENQDLGFEGENLVKRFLEKKYDATVTKVDDSYGYDFWVEIENDAFAVEVKTTETCKIPFLCRSMS